MLAHTFLENAVLCIDDRTYQVIQTQTSNASCSIKLKQPTKFAGPSVCINSRHHAFKKL